LFYLYIEPWLSCTLDGDVSDGMIDDDDGSIFEERVKF